uniref:INTS8 TPR repeats domain-containing protein n=1 Tax=Ciona savignyi TaxID=51511 RepID=H2YCB8_CIOSA
LLEEHLANSDPEPSGGSLIRQFFEQANRPVNDQGQILPPQDNQRNKKVRSLALQTAALIRWNLNELDKELAIGVRHQLLTELMKACKAVLPPATQNTSANVVESMHDHTLTALVLYCRWAARTVVKSTFPMKPGGRVTPTTPQAAPYQANSQQRMDEMRNQIIGVLKQQISNIVSFLEATLHHVDRAVFLPSFHSIHSDLLCSNNHKPGIFQRFLSDFSCLNPNNPTVDIMVSYEELHAQISYDLGCLHFAHNFYEKAGEMFANVRELLNRMVEKNTDFCCIDENTLQSYQTACHILTKPDNDIETSRLHLNLCLKPNVYRIFKKPKMLFLFTLQYYVALFDKFSFFLKWIGSCCTNTHTCMTAMEYSMSSGQWRYDELSMGGPSLYYVAGFVQQISPSLKNEEMKNLGRFLISLANNLADSSLRSQLLNFELSRHLMHEVDLNQLILRLDSEKQLPRVLEDASPSSPEDISASPSTHDVIKSMERELLSTFQPHEIKATLNRLHSATAGRRFNNLCVQWELTPPYASALPPTQDPLTADFLQISIAKAHHCIEDREYSTAKSILHYLKKNHILQVEKKLQKLVTNELLKECFELRTQLSDVVTRCRHLITSCLEQTKLTSLPVHLVQLSTAMLLNLEDFAFFMTCMLLNTSISSPPCVRYAILLSALCVALHERANDARRAARDMWSATITIFAAPTSLAPSSARGQKKPTSEIIRNLLPPSAILPRPAFIDFIKLLKNTSLLQIMVSLLVHVHRLSRTDILSDITSPNSSNINGAWPTNFDGPPTSGPCVTLALRETITHCLVINQKDRSWLRTQGDIHYAFDNFGPALTCYLLIAAHETNYFTSIPDSGPIEDEQIVRRMIKCCMQTKCFTQAAVLCQLTKDVDYPTAFKALQCNRDLVDASDLHYLEHIWNIEILEHAAYEHKEAGESAKKSIAISALSRPELNHSNSPAVGARTRKFRKERFFQALARQYL